MSWLDWNPDKELPFLTFKERLVWKVEFLELPVRVENNFGRQVWRVTVKDLETGDKYVLDMSKRLARAVIEKLGKQIVGKKAVIEKKGWGFATEYDVTELVEETVE